MLKTMADPLITPGDLNHIKEHLLKANKGSFNPGFL